MFKKFLSVAAALLCGMGAWSFELESPARIFPADSLVTLRFKAVSSWAKKNFDTVKVGYIRNDRRRISTGEQLWLGAPELIKFERENGDTIVIRDIPLRGEHEHAFQFLVPKKYAKWKPGMAVKYEERFRYVYTLRPDLFKMRPFKGETHQHSTISIHAYVVPEGHVRYARAAGYDFIAVTDHARWEQNPIVAKAAKESGSGLVTFNGEEFHSQYNVLHGVCIGAPFQITESQKDLPKKFYEEKVKPIIPEVRKELPDLDGHEVLRIAEGIALARKAKATGAVVIYCHPHWKYRGRYNAPPVYTKYMLSHNDFDAVEIVNCQINSAGDPNYQNINLLLELAYAGGRRWPVVSASDNHRVSDVARFRRNHNIIFAPECTFPEFKSALLNERLVASVETPLWDKKTDRPIYFGSWRTVELATFLFDCGYWKKHDALTMKQSELIAKFLDGDKSVVPQIEKMAKEIDACRESLYCADPKVVKPIRK